MEAAHTVEYEKGQDIIHKGDIGNIFYIILDGQVICTDIGLGTEDVPDITLNSGEWFGERALITGEPRAANVIAGTTHVKLLAFDREGFEEQLVRHGSTEYCTLVRYTSTVL